MNDRHIAVGPVELHDVVVDRVLVCTDKYRLITEIGDVLVGVLETFLIRNRTGPSALRPRLGGVFVAVEGYVPHFLRPQFRGSS